MAVPRDTQLSAVRQIQERQGNTGSFLFINPVESVKYHFTPIGAALAGRAAVTGQAFVGLPYLSPVAIPGLRGAVKAGVSKFVRPGYGEGAMALLGGGYDVGNVNPFINSLPDKMRSDTLKSFRKAIKHFRFKNIAPSRIPTQFTNMVAGNLNKMGHGIQSVSPVLEYFGGAGGQRKIIEGLWASRIGAILAPVAIGASLGYTVGRAADLAFKAGMTALDYARARAEHARSLEFGGTLGGGFKTQEAATERQRAVKMMQRHHLGGRRGLGQEAANYHVLV